MCDDFLTLTHSLQVPLGRDIEGSLLQLDLLVTFNRVKAGLHEPLKST